MRQGIFASMMIGALDVINRPPPVARQYAGHHHYLSIRPARRGKFKPRLHRKK